MSSGPSLGEAILHLVGDDSKLLTTTQTAKTKVEGILGKVGDGMKNVGVGIVATSTAITAVGGTVVKLATNAATKADDILVMASKYNLSTDQIQRMGYAAELVDVPLETMLGSFNRMTMSIGAAKKGTGEQADAFNTLGVSITDSSGQLRGANDIWLNTIDALGQVQNVTDRDILSQKLFGRSAMELNPLIVAGGDALRAYGDEAQTSGAVVSQSSVEAAGKLDDSMQKVKGTLSGIVFSLGAQLAPGVEGFVSSAGGYLQKFGSIVNDNSLTTEGKISAVSGLVSTIAQDIAGSLPELTKNGLAILMAIIQGIIDAIPTLMPAIVQIVISIIMFLIQLLPMLVQGAAQILVALATGLGQALPMLIPAIVQMLAMIINTIVQNLPLLMQAGLQLLLGLIQGLMAALPIMIQASPQIIQTFITGLVSMLPMIIVAAVQLIIALVTGLISALPVLIASVPQIITALITGLLSQLPMIIMAALQLIIALVNGLITAIPLVIAAAPQIVRALVNGLINGVGSLINVGSQLMAGFWQGLQSWFGTISARVTDFVNSMVGKIKNVLGMHSPSDVGIEIGANLGMSLPTGLETSMPKAMAASARFGAGMATELGSAASGSGIGSTSQTKNINFVINNPVGETTDDSMNRGLQRLAFLGVT